VSEFTTDFAMPRASRTILSIAAVAMAVTVGAASQASAAGLFESLFGAFRRPSPPSAAQAYAPDPVTGFIDRLIGNNSRGGQVASTQAGGSRGFCVRTCDGSYFPVQARPGMSTAEACSSFCPASEAKVFFGSNIDNAVASDGKRYADLPNAFVYRTQLKATCTCNGKAPGGLATLDAKSDPTLRPGDIVATGNGLVAYNGGRSSKTASNFTPIDAARFNKAERDKLAAIKVVAPPEEDTTASIPADYRGAIRDGETASLQPASNVTRR
jgi:hypothetical protein